MRRYFYGGFLALIIGLASVFFYRTSQEEINATGEFSGVSLRIEYAITDIQREKGLSGRESMSEDYGMLFVFDKDDMYGFWMKDMLVPIDIFWLNDKGQVVSVEESVAASSYPNVFYPSLPTRYVLETKAGFAQAHGVKIGTPLLLKNSPYISK